MTETQVAARSVSEATQQRFADLSGDRNPMHMDAVAARRTQAGAPVVHGVHTLLWALDCLAERGLLGPSLARVRVRFLKWVYVGDRAEVHLTGGIMADPAALEVTVAGLPVLAADLTFHVDPGHTPRTQNSHQQPLGVPLREAADRSITDIEGMQGEAFMGSIQEAVATFPALAKAIGGLAITEIAATSYIVGMEAPGLHSMFSKLDFSLGPASLRSSAAAGLPFEVTYTDARFRKTRVRFTGQEVEGTLEAFFRVPPVTQVGFHTIVSHVQAGEFADMRGLIVGGSRGLGELTSKLIAAGGGFPVLTYAVGRKDAEQLVEEIAGSGFQAETMAYDIRRSAEEQVAQLTERPTHVFYFATSTIFKPKLGVLSGPMLAEFVQFYLQGFYDLCVALTKRYPGEMFDVLYPSTVFVEERPAGMTEYAMVKAAGEQMCVDMNAYLPGLRILSARLPKLPTDQTAGVLPEREADALDAILPLIRQMVAASAA
jgi:hypothetical protein